MRMLSKFSGRCTRCQQTIKVGTEIDWTRETGARHAICPLVPQVAVAKQEKLVPGVYERDGEVYVVKFNRSKTNLYAKRLVQVGDGVERLTEVDDTVRAMEFEYAPGAVREIKLEDRMEIERAKELITLYGACINCGRHLKAAQSVEKGIGPVCIKSFGPVLQDTVPVVTVDGRETYAQVA